jgi:stress response protein YsnF
MNDHLPFVRAGAFGIMNLNSGHSLPLKYIAARKYFAAKGQIMETPDTAEPIESIPVMEEVLDVSKRTVSTGVVRIEKTVEAQDYIVSETLQSAQAIVERVARGVEVDPNNRPQVRIENGVTIIPVLEEILVVEKRWVLKEELHVRQAVNEVTATQRVTLNKERLVVTRTNSSDNGDA